LKPEWWGSPLAQEEKYQGRKKTCDKIVVVVVVVISSQRPAILTEVFS
jgi:hypothetical protein